MKHRKLLVKILSLCAAIGLLVCLLVVPIGAVAAETIVPFTGFTTAFDWDEVTVSASGNNGMDNTTVLSPAGFGMAWKGTKAAAGAVSTTQISLTPTTAFDTTDQGALVFWMSIPSTEAIKNITMWIADSDGNWGLTLKAPYHTVDTDGVARTHTCTTAQILTLTGGFSGWVIVPFSSLTKSSAEWSSPTITKIMFRTPHVADQDEEYIFDEFGMVAAASDALSALTTNYTSTALIDWDTNKGTVGANTASINTVAGKIGYGGTLSLSESLGTTTQVSLTPAASFALTETDAVAFWVSVPESEDKSVTLWFADGTKNWGPQIGKPYYAVDENGVGKEYLTVSDKVVSLPAGFTGWIMIPATTLYGGSAALAETTFTKVMMVLPAPIADEVYMFDELSIVSSVTKAVDTLSEFSYAASADFDVSTATPHLFSTTTSTVRDSGTQYGKELAVTIPSDSTNTRFGITPKNDIDPTRQQAFVFRLQLPSTGTAKLQSVTLWMFPSGMAYRWQPKNGEVFYAVNEENIGKTYTALDGSLSLPDGFSGWIILPFTSLYNYNTKEVYGGDVAVDRIDLTPTRPTTGTDLVYTIDEIGTVAKTDVAVAQLSDIAYTPVIDWDTVSITNIPTGGATAVKEPSPSAYGNGYTVGKGNADAVSQLTATKAMDTTGKEAAMFWISLPDTETTTNIDVWFGDGGTSRWQLIGKTTTTAAPYYLASENGTVQEGFASVNGVATLPAKFSGWVIIPFASLYHLSDSATWTDGTSLASLMLRTTNLDYYLDEIALVTSLDDTLDALSFVPYDTSYTWDTFYGSSSYQPYSNNSTNLAVAVETSPSGYGQGVSLTTGATVNATTQFRWNTSITTTASGSHAFWVSVPENNGNKSITIWLADAAGSGNWGPAFKSTYYTVDAQSGTITNVAVTADKSITLTAGFTGWVILPYENLYKSATVSTWTAPTITSMMHVYSVTANVVETYHVDEVMFTAMTGEALAERLSWQEKMMAAAGNNQEYATVQRMRAAHTEIKADAAAGTQAVTDLTVLGNVNKTNATFIQARTTDNTLRFVLEVDTRLLAYLEANYTEVEFGTLLAKQYTGEMEYSDITSGFSSTAASTIVRTSTYVPSGIDPVNGTDNTLLYTCVVRNIPESNWDTELRARSYVRFKGTDGAYHTVYGIAKTATYNMALAANQ